MFWKSHFSKLTRFEISKKINKKVKNHKKSQKKVIFIPKITNTLDFSSKKSKQNPVIFFSDFSHGITLYLFNMVFPESPFRHILEFLAFSGFFSPKKRTQRQKRNIFHCIFKMWFDQSMGFFLEKKSEKSVLLKKYIMKNPVNITA